MRITFPVIGMMTMFVSSILTADDHEKKEFRLFPTDTIEWKEGPPSLPPGANIAVLEGDPSKEGPFVFRVKAPDGYRIPVHTHPKTERITVISGTFNIGMGEKFDMALTKPMSAGTYGYWETGMKHFVWIKGETVVQFHGMGPWKIEYVNPKDDPRNQNKGSPPYADGKSASYSGVTDAELADLKLQTHLKRLSLKDSKVTDAGLVHLKEMMQLQFLSLDGTQISDAGLVYLKGLSHLKFLSLNDTKLTDAGLDHLAKMTQLRTLSIDDTQVTDAGLAHLKELKLLEWLYLNDTTVTDAGLKHLKGMTHLKFLSVINSKITGAGVDELHGALPGVRIRR